MFYLVRFKCEMCSEAGGYQGWTICRKSVVGDPTIKISKDGQKYCEGEIQMYPIFKNHDVIDPWHYDKAFRIL